MRFKFPTTKLLPQLNGNREWDAGYVSPQDGTQVRCDGRTLTDQHGTSVLVGQLTNCRVAQIIRRNLAKYFGA